MSRLYLKLKYFNSTEIKTNLNTEARIKLNFGKLRETTARVTAKTLFHHNIYTIILGHNKTINIKKAILPLVEVKFQSLLSARQSLVYKLN